MPGDGNFSGNGMFRGTVTSVSGNTLIAESSGFGGRSSTSTTGTATSFDISAATFYAMGTSALSDIKVGDTIKASGAITNTTIAATQIVIQ
jgi:hypothetical protein